MFVRQRREVDRDGAEITLMTHDINGCCGINLSWYRVSSNFAAYKCEH